MSGNGEIELRLSKARAVYADLVSRGAPYADCKRMADRITDLEMELQRAAERAAHKASRISGGTHADRFLTLAGRTVHLTDYHIRVAFAWRDVDDLRVSGGSDWGVPGPGASGVDWARGHRTRDKDGRPLPPPPTFKPRRVKAQRRVSDGGFAAAVDRGRLRARATSAYAGAVVERYGDDARCEGLIRAGRRVILSNVRASDALAEHVGGRRSVYRERLSISMAAGLSAIGGVLSIEQRSFGLMKGG